MLTHEPAVINESCLQVILNTSTLTKNPTFFDYFPIKFGSALVFEPSD